MLQTADQSQRISIVTAQSNHIAQGNSINGQAHFWRQEEAAHPSQIRLTEQPRTHMTHYTASAESCRPPILTSIANALFSVTSSSSIDRVKSIMAWRPLNTPVDFFNGTVRNGAGAVCVCVCVCVMITEGKAHGSTRDCMSVSVVVAFETAVHDCALISRAKRRSRYLVGGCWQLLLTLRCARCTPPQSAPRWDVILKKAYGHRYLTPRVSTPVNTACVSVSVFTCTHFNCSVFARCSTSTRVLDKK